MICFGTRRSTLLSGVVVFLFLVIFWHHDDLPDHVEFLSMRPFASPIERLNVSSVASSEDLQNVHLFLPVPKDHASLCKTILSAAVLNYPVPTLISYNQSFSNAHLVGGGRHVAKIEAIARTLDSTTTEQDDNIVVIVDAYGGFNYETSQEGIDAHLEGDAWFQLPLEVLIDRYHALIRKSNEDLASFMGKAYDETKTRQSVIFGSSKRCTPNNAESAACYPIPESPLPHRLYGKYTDAPATQEGQPPFGSHRQRFLNSGFIIGPVRDLRPLFARARAMAEALSTPGRPADGLEGGSDQAIFSAIFGEQEFRREDLRRSHGEKPRRKTTVAGVAVDDILDPSFPHQVLPNDDESRAQAEFGIAIDYWSDLEMQTADSLDEGRWLTYKQQPVDAQLLAVPRQPWSCVPHLSGSLPPELVNSTSLPRAAVSEASQYSPQHGWDEIPLYTNVCLDTVPAVINHNADAARRSRDWPEMWMQPHARRLIEEILARGEAGEEERGGAYMSATGRYMGWQELCPAKFENELYREDAELI